MINIYKRLNSAIEYIEQDIFEEPDMKKLCRLLELSSNVASPLFELFTGYTIKDYIRKRRLSESVFLLGKERIIDIAITCGYDTREGFSRAFKAFHGVNPSKCLKEFNYLDKIHFDEELLLRPLKHLELTTLPTQNLYGKTITINAKNFDREVVNLWTKLEKEYPSFEGFGISKRKGDKIEYTIASEIKFDDADKVVLLNGGRYVLSDKANEKLTKSSQIGLIEMRKDEKIKYIYLID